MLQVPLLQKKPPYDPLTAFTPVSLVGRYTFLLVVTPSLGVNTFKEFVAYARNNPGKINFSTYSGASQLAYAQIVKNAGVDMLRVPYKGEAPSVTDILGGTIHAVFATPTSSFSHIQSGRLKALAVTLPQRWPLLPEVPTTVEAGMPPINVEFFAAMFGPAGMPAEIATRVSQELNKIIARPAIRERSTSRASPLPARLPRSWAPLRSGSSAPGLRDSRKPGSIPNKVTALALALAATLVFGQPTAGQPTASQPLKPGTYRGSGVVMAVDRDMNRVTIEVEPVEALKLPALALAFIVYDSASGAASREGKLDFEFMKQGNNYVLLRVLKPTP
jgi:Cu/Ag efflux protein CusF